MVEPVKKLDEFRESRKRAKLKSSKKAATNVQMAIIAVAVIAVIAFGVYYVWLKPKPQLSREDAIEIVIDKTAEPSEAPRGLRVYSYPKLLPKGSTIEPYYEWTKEEKGFMVCENDCWFFWFDDDPLAQFAHETRFVIVDAVTGDVTVREAEWWPVINDEVVWGSTEERKSDEFLIFEIKVELELHADWKHDFTLQAQPGCEMWAVVVCGSDDVGNTFEEDTRYIYNVLTGLGYADSHIFYVSPFTTDPGVDRVTSIANVHWAINQAAANSDSEDKVFLFYSAHGGVDDLQCNPGAPGGGHVSSFDMDSWLDNVTSRDLIVLLQGCHTGSFIGAYANGTVVASENELTGDGETNRIVMTATDTLHSSYGGSSSWGSTFTGGYVAAFNVTAADVDGNGAISVEEAYTYAWDHDSARINGWSFPQRDATSLDPEKVFHVCDEVDVWISDGLNDLGDNSYDYDSTDIWSSLSPNGTSHEDAVSGLTNYVHVAVHNIGSLAGSNVNVTLYWADTSAALAWPADFNRIGASYIIPNIPAGGSEEHVWSWYVDPSIGLGHNFCFVATASCSADPMTGGPPGLTYPAPYDNNIAQKNIDIVEGGAGQTMQARFFIENNMAEATPFDLVIDRSDLQEGRLILDLPDDLTKVLVEDPKRLEGLELVEREGKELPDLMITAKTKAVIRQIRLEPTERREVILEVEVPRGAEVGDEFHVRIEEVVEGESVGAVSLLVRVVSMDDCRSTMRLAAEVFAQISHKHGSDMASNLVDEIGRMLVEDLCEDPKKMMEFLRMNIDAERGVAEDLSGKVDEDDLKAYLEALDVLSEVLEEQDYMNMMNAQKAVVTAALHFFK